MNKCFITKIPSSVDNNTLPVLGQLKIKWLKQDTLPNNDACAIGLSTIDSITVKVYGAHFTDSTLTSNVGNVKTITATDGLVWLYVSNDVDAFLTIDNKYSLTQMNLSKSDTNTLIRSISFDIEDIKYCTNLTFLNFNFTQVSGDISAFSKLNNLTLLSSSNTQVSGDISAISNLTNLGVLNIPYTQVSGDISAVSNLTNLDTLVLANTQVSGDISAISNLVKLTNLRLSNTQVSGKVDSLTGLTKLVSIADLDGTSLTGDMSKIPANTYFIAQNNRKVTTNFTWTANGRKNAKLLAMGNNIPFDTASMDNMLIDQATCTFTPTTYPWTKVISVLGARTSASDAAVTAIQNMGVTLTNLTKVS